MIKQRKKREVENCILTKLLFLTNTACTLAQLEVERLNVEFFEEIQRDLLLILSVSILCVEALTVAKHFNRKLKLRLTQLYNR